jgi:hypothetical protein
MKASTDRAIRETQFAYSLWVSTAFGLSCRQESKYRSHKKPKNLESLGVPLFNWPPSSPDMNPIENLWALMKRQAGYYCPVTNKNEENAQKMADRVRKVIANDLRSRR